MTNPAQAKQQRFTELMLKYQRETEFTEAIPEQLYAWKWNAMQFLCIKKSGIQPAEFKEMLLKQSGYTILEMAHIISAIEIRPAKDLELELDEFVECQSVVATLRAKLNETIEPVQKVLEAQVFKEFDEQEKVATFSDKLKKGIANKNKTIDLKPKAEA